MTIGKCPPSLQRQSFSTRLFAIVVLPSRYPFEFQTVAQQVPAMSLGIHSGKPARSETATNACCKVGCAGDCRAGPKMRLMQALKYTAAAFVRFVVGSDAFAARGIAGIG